MSLECAQWLYNKMTKKHSIIGDIFHTSKLGTVSCKLKETGTSFQSFNRKLQCTMFFMSF